MNLYLNESGKLTEIKEKVFLLERDIQKIFEANIDSLMSIKLVKSEFTIKNKRIDTLGYDEFSKAFTIIEYKRDKNISVVDQGFTYLSLMLENKADFIVEYNESLKGNLKREDVDWSQSKVAFVSTSFTSNQVQATNFKDISIELWEVKQYENNSILISQIKKTSSAESIKPLTTKSEKLKAVTEEIKVYTEAGHLDKASDLIKELYEKFKLAILNLDDDIDINAKKWYISFKKSRNFTYVEVYKSSLKFILSIKKGELDDPKGLARDVSNIGHGGYGDYQVQVDNDKNLEYIMSLIKQTI